MNNSDGSLNFDTTVNTDGIDKGSVDIQEAFKRIVASVEELGNKLSQQIKQCFNDVNTTKVEKEVGKVDTASKKVEKQVHRTKKALDSLDDVDGPSAIKAQIEQDTAALEKLKVQQSEWDNVGVPKDSGGYQSLIAQIEELESSIAYAKTELQELSAVQNESSAIAGQQALSEEQAAAGAKGVADSASKKARAQSEAQASNTKLQSSEENLGNSSSRLKTIFGAIADSVQWLGLRVGKLSGKFNKIKSVGSNAFKSIKSHIVGSDSALAKFGKRLSSSLSMYSRVFKMMLLFQLFSAGMDLVKNQIGGALTQNAQFCASLAAIKGNLAIAFQPIYNAILPALNTLMAGIRQATIWLASFTHTLFGGSVKSSVAAAKAIDAQTNSTKGLTKATQKQAKAQSDLDELNIIPDNSNSSDPSSGTGSTGVQPSYGDADLISGQNAFAEKLKEAWANSDFTEIGQIVADKINDALNSINWDKIQATAKKIALCLATFLNGFVGELDWGLVGSTIANGLNTALIFAYTFLTTFNFLKFGQAIGTMINSGVSTFNWALLGSAIAAGFNAAFDFVYGFVTTMDWAQLGTSIGTAITTFFQDTDWAELGMDLSGLVLGLLTLLDTTIESTDWTEVGTSIGDVIKNIDWPTVFQEVWNVITDAFGGLKDVLTGFLTSIGMDENTAQIISEFATAIGAVTLAFGPLSKILGTVNGVMDIFKDKNALIALAIAAVIVIIYELITHWDDVVATMKKVGEFLGGVFKAAWNGIVDTMKSVLEFISGVFSHNWEQEFGVFGGVINAFCQNAKNIFGDVKDIFSGVIDFIHGVFTLNWKQAWQGVVEIFKGVFNLIGDIAKAPINLVIGLINGMLSGIETGLNWMANKVNSFKIEVPSWVPGIGGKHWGFNLGQVSFGRIPYLATGAVIPANNPFVAMLGDQKHGNNIEAPEGLIRKIVDDGNAKLLSSLMSSSNQNIKVNVNLTGEMANLFTAFVEEYHKQASVTGSDPLLGI